MDTERHGDKLRIGVTYNELQLAADPTYSEFAGREPLLSARRNYIRGLGAQGIHGSQSRELAWLEGRVNDGRLVPLLLGAFTACVTNIDGPVRSILDAEPSYDPFSLEAIRALAIRRMLQPAIDQLTKLYEEVERSTKLADVLQGLVRGAKRPTEEGRRKLATHPLTIALLKAGVRLLEIESDSGTPIHRIVSDDAIIREVNRLRKTEGQMPVTKVVRTDRWPYRGDYIRDLEAYMRYISDTDNVLAAP